MAKMCPKCGAKIEEYDVYDPQTGKAVDTERTCPNFWRHA